MDILSVYSGTAGSDVAEDDWNEDRGKCTSGSPFWICWTHNDQLVVSMVTPNLVNIDAVVSIT